MLATMVQKRRLSIVWNRIKNCLDPFLLDKSRKHLWGYYSSLPSSVILVGFINSVIDHKLFDSAT